MLEGWAFLIIEMWALIAIAAGFGFVAGWIVSGSRNHGRVSKAWQGKAYAGKAELERLRQELKSNKNR